jgi:hypothetical protein
LVDYPIAYASRRAQLFSFIQTVHHHLITDVGISSQMSVEYFDFSGYEKSNAEGAKASPCSARVVPPLHGLKPRFIEKTSAAVTRWRLRVYVSRNSPPQRIGLDVEDTADIGGPVGAVWLWHCKPMRRDHYGRG